MSTIRDVARVAGVSVATVSRVINQKGYVHKKTAEKVRNAIEQLKFEPNTVARGLASKKTGTIAMILPDIINPFFAELARAVEDTATLLQYTVIFCNSDDLSPKKRRYIEILSKRFVEGIIFASNTLEIEEIEYVKKNNIPLVVLDRTPGQNICRGIRAKNLEGAKMATRHLLSIGCRKIAHIAGPQRLIPARERLKGYLQEVESTDWFTPSLIVESHYTIMDGYHAAKKMLEKHPDVDGIFAGNDLIAVGALKSLQRMGYRVPDQVALCGFDGIDLTQITEPEITTIAQPIYQMGKEAVMDLIKQMNGEKLPNCVVELDVELLIRGSTDKKSVT